jgi:hypothetical protein
VTATYASSLRVGRNAVRKAIATVVLGVASLGLVVPSAAAQSPSDREIAKAGVFQEGDFPAGWRATPHKKNKTDALDCPTFKKAAAATRKSKTADADSDDFERRDDKYTSSIIVFRTEDVSRRAYGAVASDSMHRCLERFVKSELKKIGESEGVDVKVETGTVTGTGSYGDESSDFGFTATVSQGTLSQDVFADIVFVRVGRSLGLYSRSSTSEPSEFDTPTFDELLTSATGRLTAATGGQTTTATTQ